MRFITHHKLRQKLVHDILLHINAAAAQADLALIGKAEGSLWNRSECVTATKHGFFPRSNVSLPCSGQLRGDGRNVNVVTDDSRVFASKLKRRKRQPVRRLEEQSYETYY